MQVLDFEQSIVELDQKIHIGEEFSEDFEDDRDMYGFPFETYEDNKELVKYIQGKTKSLKI